MEFLGVGAAEALVVFVLILILVGPQRFPELMRQGGRYYRIARGYTSEVMRDVRAAVDELEQEVKEDADLQAVRELAEVRQDLERDLSDARRDADAAGAETAAAAQSVADGERTSSNAPRPISSAPSVGGGTSNRPSTRRQQNASAKTASTSSAAAKPAAKPATTPAAKPAPRVTKAETPRVEVPLPADDPFKALEARRAAQRSSTPDADESAEKADA